MAAMNTPEFPAFAAIRSLGPLGDKYPHRILRVAFRADWGVTFLCSFRWTRTAATKCSIVSRHIGITSTRAFQSASSGTQTAPSTMTSRALAAARALRRRHLLGEELGDPGPLWRARGQAPLRTQHGAACHGRHELAERRVSR